MSVLRRAWFAACFLLALSASASAVPCGSGGFEGWLEAFKREAAAQGISARSIASALNGVSYDPGIVSRDHAQGVFRQSFEQLAGRMVSAERLQKGAGLLRRRELRSRFQMQWQKSHAARPPHEDRDVDQRQRGGYLAEGLHHEPPVIGVVIEDVH